MFIKLPGVLSIRRWQHRNARIAARFTSTCLIRNAMIPYKTLLISLLLGNISLVSTWAATVPANAPTTTGWTASPNATLLVRTLIDRRDELVVQVQNPGTRHLTLVIRASDGAEVATQFLDRQPMHSVRVNLSDLPSDTYLLEIANGIEVIRKQFVLTPAINQLRSKSIAVLGTETTGTPIPEGIPHPMNGL